MRKEPSRVDTRGGKRLTEDDGVVVHGANGLVESLIHGGEVNGIRITRTKQETGLSVNPARPGLLKEEGEKQRKTERNRVKPPMGTGLGLGGR